MAVLPADQREQLLPAIWGALGWSPSVAAEARPLAERVQSVLDDQRRERWEDLLGSLREADPADLGVTWWTVVGYMARRAGLLAGPDLRQAFRVVARIEQDVERPRVVARIDELDEHVASSDILQDIVAFAASPAFGRLLAEATRVDVE